MLRTARVLASLSVCTAAACGSSDESPAASAGASSSADTTSTSSQGAGGAAGTGGAGGAGSPSGTIVPLYTYPTDPSWAALLAAHEQHASVPVRVIINPDSGPGASADPAYADGIATLADHDMTVLAYVATTYGQKPKASVHAEMDDYAAYYPALGGFFFDEMASDAGFEGYYDELRQHAVSQGMPVTVGNPGTDTLPSYVGTVDTMLVYESDGLPGEGAFGRWIDGYDRKSFGIIPYAVPALDAAALTVYRAQVGFIYVTDDTLPNPWDSLPAYFPDLLQALE